MICLETERLFLCPFQMADLDRMTVLFANPDFMRFSPGVFDRTKTIAFLEKVIAWNRDGRPSQFAVTVKSEETLIGYCGFFHQVVDDTDEIEIGYRLHPEYWNKGIATEAARVVRDHGFRDLELPRVISLIHPDNIASRRVVEKIGMTLEKETVFRGFPTRVFSITRPQWQQACDG